MASETISYSLGDGNLIINDADTHPTADSDILEFDDFDDIDEVYRDGNDLVFLMTDGAIIRAVDHFFGKDLEQIKDVTNNVTLDVSFSLTGFAGTDDLVVGTTGDDIIDGFSGDDILSGDHDPQRRPRQRQHLRRRRRRLAHRRRWRRPPRGR